MRQQRLRGPDRNILAVGGGAASCLLELSRWGLRGTKLNLRVRAQDSSKLPDPTQRDTWPRPLQWLAPSCILGPRQPHLGLGVNGEAQQPVVHLQGHRVAPGFQVLLPQKGGQAREHLEEESQSVSVPLASARCEKSLTPGNAKGICLRVHGVPTPLTGSNQALASSDAPWTATEGILRPNH